MNHQRERETNRERARERERESSDKVQTSEVSGGLRPKLDPGTWLVGVAPEAQLLQLVRRSWGPMNKKRIYHGIATQANPLDVYSNFLQGQLGIAAWASTSASGPQKPSAVEAQTRSCRPLICILKGLCRALSNAAGMLSQDLKRPEYMQQQNQTSTARTKIPLKTKTPETKSRCNKNTTWQPLSNPLPTP